MRAGDPEDDGSDAPVSPVAGAGDDALASTEAHVEEALPAALSDAGRIAALERDVKEAQDGRLRMAADFDNYRKRARRDIDDGARRVREDTLGAILPTADNLERALDHADESNVAAVVEGVRLVLRQLLATLERYEVRPFDAIGVAFNPEEHDAVGQVETADAPAGSVVREMARGYRIGSRVLRPAMVVVARPPVATPDPDAAGSPPDGDAPAAPPGGDAS